MVSRAPAAATHVWDAWRAGIPPPMFVYRKRSGRPGQSKFYWWPLLLSLLVSVLVTLAINAR